MAKKRPTKTKHGNTIAAVLKDAASRELERQRLISFNDAPAEELMRFCGDIRGLDGYLDGLTKRRQQDGKKQTKKN